ncbi:MAG: DUF309 domain-containing protein [Gemmataceae bacterium]
MQPEQRNPETTEPTPNFQQPTTPYLEGVRLFNLGEFFEAHEVWEDLWMECPSAERRFFQALIQAAVALYHFGRGNHAGATRLFNSGRRYMEPYRPVYLGLDVDEFWRTMESHMAPALIGGAAGPKPKIVLLSDAKDTE